jgi:recombination protein RecT
MGCPLPPSSPPVLLASLPFLPPEIPVSNDLAIVESNILAQRDTFEQVLVDRSINFYREAAFATQILQANDYALGIARKNPQSVIDAVTNIAAVGISLNPATKHAYLVPRDGKIILDISYRGMLHLAIASGSLRWGQAEVVYEADTFVVGGYSEPPIHTRHPFGPDRGEIVGTYCVVRTIDGDYLTTTMPIAEVYSVRDRSESWKSHVAKKTKTPWQTDPGEMIKKTVIKRAYKTWPMSERVQKAGHILDTDGGEGFGTVDEVKTAPSEVLAPAKAAAAGGLVEMRKHWKGLSDADRAALAPHMPELDAIVAEAEKGAKDERIAANVREESKS